MCALPGWRTGMVNPRYSGFCGGGRFSDGSPSPYFSARLSRRERPSASCPPADSNYGLAIKEDCNREEETQACGKDQLAGAALAETQIDGVSSGNGTTTPAKR